MKKFWWIIPLITIIAIISISARAGSPAGDAALGTQPYDNFETDAVCAECHVDIARQHQQAMMSQSFTHHWDEIEYFELALPHSEKVEKVAGVKAGCNGCHAPLAFLAGDIPPKPPAEGTRANEGVSCDLCHAITGHEGEVPFNFNFTVDPAAGTQGTRAGVESPGHEIVVNPFLGTAEFCGTCHNEKDPWGLWVKATHLEWKESPQAAAGIVCQDCHMPPAAGNSAPETGGVDHPDVRQHLFHGAHDTGKLMGAVEVRIHPSEVTAKPGQELVFTATVVNAKAGHMIPSGSAEERVVWLHVEAVDASGATHHLPSGCQGIRRRGAHHRFRRRHGLPGHRRHQGHRGVRRDQTRRRCAGRRPDLPAALSRSAGPDDGGPVEHRRRSGPTTGWRRSRPGTRPSPGSSPRTCPPASSR